MNRSSISLRLLLPVVLLAAGATWAGVSTFGADSASDSRARDRADEQRSSDVHVEPALDGVARRPASTHGELRVLAVSRRRPGPAWNGEADERHTHAGAEVIAVPLPEDAARAESELRIDGTPHMLASIPTEIRGAKDADWLAVERGCTAIWLAPLTHIDSVQLDGSGLVAPEHAGPSSGVSLDVDLAQESAPGGRALFGPILVPSATRRSRWLTFRTAARGVGRVRLNHGDAAAVVPIVEGCTLRVQVRSVLPVPALELRVWAGEDPSAPLVREHLEELVDRIRPWSVFDALAPGVLHVGLFLPGGVAPVLPTQSVELSSGGTTDVLFDVASRLETGVRDHRLELELFDSHESLGLLLQETIAYALVPADPIARAWPVLTGLSQPVSAMHLRPDESGYVYWQDLSLAVPDGTYEVRLTGFGIIGQIRLGAGEPHVQRVVCPTLNEVRVSVQSGSPELAERVQWGARSLDPGGEKQLSAVSATDADGFFVYVLPGPLTLTGLHPEHGSQQTTLPITPSTKSVEVRWDPPLRLQVEVFEDGRRAFLPRESWAHLELIAGTDTISRSLQEIEVDRRRGVTHAAWVWPTTIGRMTVRIPASSAHAELTATVDLSSPEQSVRLEL